MEIPAELIISVSSVLANEHFERFCASLNVQLTPYDVLAIYLLFLLKSSPADEYVQSLPKKFDCPLTWRLENLRVRAAKKS